MFIKKGEHLHFYPLLQRTHSDTTNDVHKEFLGLPLEHGVDTTLGFSSKGMIRLLRSDQLKLRKGEPVFFNGERIWPIWYTPTGNEDPNVTVVKPAKETEMKMAETASLASPQGFKYRIPENRKEFAEKHGLDPSNLSRLISGKITQHKGWKLV